MSAKSDGAAQAANGVTTTVVPDDSSDATYSMLEPTALTTDGGFLAGSLFFEVHEEFTLQVSRANVETLRVRVRVVEIERGEEPGMWVEFVGMDDVERRHLAELIKTE